MNTFYIFGSRLQTKLANKFHLPPFFVFTGRIGCSMALRAKNSIISGVFFYERLGFEKEVAELLATRLTVYCNMGIKKRFGTNSNSLALNSNMFRGLKSGVGKIVSVWPFRKFTVQHAC